MWKSRLGVFWFGTKPAVCHNSKIPIMPHSVWSIHNQSGFPISSSLCYVVPCLLFLFLSRTEVFCPSGVAVVCGLVQELNRFDVEVCDAKLIPDLTTSHMI